MKVKRKEGAVGAWAVRYREGIRDGERQRKVLQMRDLQRQTKVEVRVDKQRKRKRD